MTGFNDITSSDHCGFYLNVQLEAITNPQDISTPFPFERKINSKSSQAIRMYKKYMKTKVEQDQCKKNEIKLNANSLQKKTNMTWGNQIKSIGQTNNKYNAQSWKQHQRSNSTYPWSPELHDAVRLVTIWKAKLTQYKTKLSHLNQIEYFTKSMKIAINTSWKHPLELKRNIQVVTKELKKIRRKAKELRNYTSQKELQ